VTAAAKDLVEIVRQLLMARDARSAVFVMELFRGSPTARNKAAVSLEQLHTANLCDLERLSWGGDQKRAKEGPAALGVSSSCSQAAPLRTTRQR
jgi:hypothetical protein